MLVADRRACIWRRWHVCESAWPWWAGLVCWLHQWTNRSLPRQLRRSYFPLILLYRLVWSGKTSNDLQAEPKKYSNTKVTMSQKCANDFVLNLAHLFRRQLVQKCAALCCIYFTYAKLTETQTSRMNFATVQTVHCTMADFIIKVIECPIPPLLWCHCDVGIIIWFTLKK